MSWLSEAINQVLRDKHLTSSVPPEDFRPAVETRARNLAEKLVDAMEKHGYTVFKDIGEVNIVYIEGANLDGTMNDDKPNRFNDFRCTITFLRSENTDDWINHINKPVISGIWEATTEPGKYWEEHPLSPKGAARIKFGQYSAWQVGIHNASKPSGHEALVQTGGKVTVCRDLNEDNIRTGDEEDTGFFGINQHHGYNMSVDNVNNASAGCLVGRTIDGHKQFMEIVKADPRYKKDHKFVFTATVMDAKDIA